MSVELAVPIMNRGTYLIPGYLVQGHCEKLFDAALSQEFQDKQQFQLQQISDGQSLEITNGVILEAMERFDSFPNSFPENLW